jgi:hypothetical protein
LIVPQEKDSFGVFDNMSYRGKPDTTLDGLVLSNIVYEGSIWPHDKNYGVLPSRDAFDAVIRAHMANRGPLVLDIERLPLSGSPETVRQHLKVLATLADWARASAPGKVVGYYGTGTLTHVPPTNVTAARELARHVDAFFPPMYSFDDDHQAWAKRAEAEAAEDRALAPGKPLFFYLWPQYHDGTPKQFQYVDAAFWQFQLRTARRDADGIVLWSPGRFNWDETNGWWTATQEFMRSLHARMASDTESLIRFTEPTWFNLSHPTLRGATTWGSGSSPGRVTPGDCSPEVPTDPDMRNCRIRLFSTRLRYVAGRGCVACGSG